MARLYYRDALGRFASGRKRRRPRSPFAQALEIAKATPAGKPSKRRALRIRKARRKYAKLPPTPYGVAIREVKRLALKRRVAAYKGIARRRPKAEKVRRLLNRSERSKNKAFKARANAYKKRTANERRLTSAVRTILDSRNPDGSPMYTREQAIGAVAEFAAKHREWVEGGEVGAEPVFEYPTAV